MTGEIEVRLTEEFDLPVAGPVGPGPAEAGPASAHVLSFREAGGPDPEAGFAPA